MSEVVMLRMRAVAAEIKELERIGLYSPRESKVILNMQENFEYKVNGASKHLQDIKDYITYLKAFLKQIDIRRNQLRIGEKKGAIEFKISKRIQDLYEIGLRRFSDFNFCYSYFMFCKSRKSITVTTAENMIAKYFHNPDIFRIVSKWYLDDQNNSKGALKVINKGLVFHKNDLFLYKDAIELLIKNENPEKKIEKYVSYILKWAKDSKILIEILELLEPLESTVSIQHTIVTELLENFTELAVVWHVLAQREYKGLHNPDEIVSDDNFTLCIEKYKKGLKQVSKSERQLLKTFYIQFLISSMSKNDGHTINHKSSVLKSTFEEFSNEGSLPEDRFYIIWSGLYSSKKVVEILEKGMSAYPQSFNLWKAYFNYAKTSDNSHLLEEVHRKSLEALEDEAYKMWEIYIDHHRQVSSEEVVERIFKEAFVNPDIRKMLELKYEDWILRHDKEEQENSDEEENNSEEEEENSEVEEENSEVEEETSEVEQENFGVEEENSEEEENCEVEEENSEGEENCEVEEETSEEDSN